MSNFIKDCITGHALMTEIDDYIDLWHEGDSELSLSEFLGMTTSEYALFVEDESYLASIITAHKTDQNIRSIMKQHLSIAARSDDSSKTEQIQRWLENENLWK